MRADKFFADRFSSRTKAAEAIERGLIKVNGKFIKPSDDVSEGDDILFIKAQEQFVSNGGYKLSKALKDFSFSPAGMIFADIGASTGGFTDCLLQNGAKKVYCVDVGESLLDEKIKADKRVISIENCNARYMDKSYFPDEIAGVTADVSFISLKLVLPAAADILKDGGVIFALIKPQFECENKNIGKSGIVSKSAHKKIISSIYDFCIENSLAPMDITNAPIREKKNIEYVAFLVKGGKAPLKKEEFLMRAANLN